MDPCLLDALAPYLVARLDGSEAEGLHRSTKLSKLRAPSSKVPFWASTIRMLQNIEEYKEAVAHPDLKQLFMAFFASPARLYHHYWPSPPNLPKITKIQRGTLIAKTYRCYPYNFEDWHLLKDALAATKRPAHREVLRDLQALQLDFYQAVFKKGSVVTFPSADWRATSVAPDTHQAPAAALEIIEVVATDICGKKVVHDHPGAKMRLPLYIQKHRALPASNIRESLVTEALDTPHLVDGPSLLSWSIATTELQVWRATEVQQDSCATFRSPTNIRELYPDPMSSDISGWHLLLHLKHAGWKYQDERCVHTANARGRIARAGVHLRKDYLRVLLRMDGLFAEGVTEIHSHQHNIYYTALLHASDKRGIRPNLLVRDYMAILQGREPELSGARNRAQRAEPRDPVDDHDNVLQAEVSSSESEYLDPMEQPGPEEGQQAQGSGDGRLQELVPPAELPTLVEGALLRFDFSPQHGYQRLCVHCPFSHAQHRHSLPCRKYRGLAASQTSNLGQFEAVAFLGRWLQQAHAFADRKTHVAYSPSEAETLAYAAAQGWTRAQ